METRTNSASVPWLSEAEQSAWRRYLKGSRRLETVLDRDLLEHGMSLSEYEILSMLSEAPRKRMRMSSLADLVVQSRSRVTHTANRLEKRGWVERQRCSTDSRGRELVLTTEGGEAVVAASEIHVRSVRRYLIEALTPQEFHALGVAMGKIDEHIEATPAA